MVNSKSWDWSKNESNQWLIPTMESNYLRDSWKAKGCTSILDLGCGLGRHSIFFAKNGFSVNAVDLSDYAVNYLKDWAQIESLSVLTLTCDMLHLPYKDHQFDCIVAYNVIYHTDTQGFFKQ